MPRFTVVEKAVAVVEYIYEVTAKNAAAAQEKASSGEVDPVSSEIGDILHTRGYEVSKTA